MSYRNFFQYLSPILLAGSLLLSAPNRVNAAIAPVVLTVPSVPTNPVTPHQTWSGNTNFTLKGTASSAAPTDAFTYDWDPGDGGTHCTGAVTMPAYVIQCAHTYSGATGTVYKATLTVKDTTDGASGNNVTYVTIAAPPPNLPIEVNQAIENGLWYIHQHMARTSANGLNYGNWDSGDGSYVDSAQVGYHSGATGSNCNAYEASGFLQNTAPVNPYNDDVARCLNSIFNYLKTTNIKGVTIATPSGNVNPDQNGNGIAVGPTEGQPLYQSGMLMDAIVDANTPTAPVTVANTSTLSGLTGKSGGAYAYSDALQDMVDYYVYCQASQNNSFSGLIAGGWRYSCQDEQSDNSPSQWAAIGIIAARREAASAIDPNALLNNQTWLETSFDPTNHWFGYTSNQPLWGPYAVTPSGMVQLAMNGYGRGTTLPISGKQTPIWDDAESLIRDNFANPESAGSSTSIKDYYYGLYSFTKSMLLHDNSKTGLTSTPIQFLESLDNAANTPIDWYAAQSATYGGTDPTDGVARTLVNDQIYDGSHNGAWFRHSDFTGDHWYFDTAWAVTMLNRTVFQQVPVACATATPNPVANTGFVALNGACSVEQNPSATITTWAWTIALPSGTLSISPTSNNSYCTSPSCVTLKPIQFTIPAASVPGSVAVTLKVTDSKSLTSTFSLTVNIDAPPNPPTANAGGPYNFCTLADAAKPDKLAYGPWIVDGSRSTNPDSAQYPADQIVSYQWDWACANTFTSASGEQVNVSPDKGTGFPTTGTFNICLKVTNNANSVLPGNPPNGTAVGSAQVTINSGANCMHCVQTLQATAKPSVPGTPGYVQILWIDTNGGGATAIDHYNIYRSSSSTFIPFTEIAGGSSNLPAVQAPVSTTQQLSFTDTAVTAGNTYYYRVAPATADNTETCTSNITLMVTVPKGR